MDRYAYAHPQVGYNLRAAHFERRPDGMTAYFRLSLPLVVGGKLGAKRADGTYSPAPYTYNKLESGQVFHYLDIGAVRKDALGLGKLLAAGHSLVVDGKEIAPKLISVRVHPRGHVPPFSTLAEAKSAAVGPVYPALDEEIDSGYVLVDAVVIYSHGGAIDVFAISSSLQPGELGEPRTRNIFWDHRGEKTQMYDIPGPLDAALLVDPKRPPAARE
jgi:hypothetical protein